MFELMGILDFDYIINSQVLWGCYACVADLDIAEMHHPPQCSGGYHPTLPLEWDTTDIGG